MARILIVDDEQRIGDLVLEALERAGHDAVFARGGPAALKRIEAEAFDLVITDLKMPDVDGMALLRAIRKRSATTPVILMTAYGSIPGAVDAIQAGASDYLVKPFPLEELRGKVTRLLSREREGKAELDPVEKLVGESPPWKAVVDAARRVAPRDTSVLLVGETGTGKELVARAIHALSPRAKQRLVAVNCAALPETLLESELFGHEKGAFTGAVAKRRGLAEAAHNGTLFLDEVGELSPSTQSKLLRFLQEQTFCRLGSTETVKVDTRVIAATNRNLQSEAAGGTFREDLFYRLNVFPIELPPLRERRDDLSLLIDHLLRDEGHEPSKLDESARQRLTRHSWPGNVRELQNVLERAVILAGDGRILVEHLPPNLTESLTAPASANAPLSLADHERALIEQALRESGGNKSAAARLLGISRRRLYSLMERLDPPIE